MPFFSFYSSDDLLFILALLGVKIVNRNENAISKENEPPKTAYRKQKNIFHGIDRPLFRKTVVFEDTFQTRKKGYKTAPKAEKVFKKLNAPYREQSLILHLHILSSLQADIPKGRK